MAIFRSLTFLLNLDPPGALCRSMTSQLRIYNCWVICIDLSISVNYLFRLRNTRRVLFKFWLWPKDISQNLSGKKSAFAFALCCFLSLSRHPERMLYPLHQACPASPIEAWLVENLHSVYYIPHLVDTPRVKEKLHDDTSVANSKYNQTLTIFGPLTSCAQVVNRLEISDRANFGAYSRTGIEFLGSNYNSIIQSNLASNCKPISSELSKLVHSKTWHFTLTQPFPRDFWLPVHRRGYWY